MYANRGVEDGIGLNWMTAVLFLKVILRIMSKGFQLIAITSMFVSVKAAVKLGMVVYGRVRIFMHFVPLMQAFPLRIPSLDIRAT